MKKGKLLTLLPLMAMTLAGCNLNNQTASTYDPYASREIEAYNVYLGDGNDFHLSTDWYGSDVGPFTLTKNGKEITVSYAKEANYEYTNLYTTVQGRFADFEYLNFKAKGTPGKGIAFRMYYGSGETELNNVLGNDVSFSLSEN